MLDLKKLDPTLIHCLEDRGNKDLKSLSVGYAFREYCEWIDAGDPNTADRIVQVLDNIRQASDEIHTVNVLVVKDNAILQNFAFTDASPREAMRQAKEKKRQLAKKFPKETILISEAK
jgi:hypothetical protein